MKHLIILLCLLTFTINVNGQFFVAPNGDDNNPGTINLPWKTWNKGFYNDVTQPGDTVFFRSGVYMSTKRVGMQPWTGPRWFSHYTKDSITYMGYPPDVLTGNYPILDCKNHENTIPVSPYNPRYNIGVALINAEHVTLKDLHIRNVYPIDGVLAPAIAVIGNNIRYENVVIENASMGFWHVSTAYFEEDSIAIKRDSLWMDMHEYHALMNVVEGRKHHSDPGPAMWWDTVHFRPPDSSIWLNCDVSNICDTLTFGLDDKYNSYGVKVYSQFNDYCIEDTGTYGDAYKVLGFNGNYYQFEGCRAWDYSGDGFDIRGGKRVFKNCWTMPSFYYENHNLANGFVTSSQQLGLLQLYDSTYTCELIMDTLTYFEKCLAMFVPNKAFYHGYSGNVGDRSVYLNNTVYMSGTAFTLHVPDTNASYYNNLEYSTDTSIIFASSVFEDKNTWDSTINPIITDFITLDSTTLSTLFTAPRDSNNNLPNDLPLALSASSTLIDAGVDVGLEYNGNAPDIGYAESDYGEVIQNIELIEGWNIASFFVEPYVWNMLNLVNPLIEDSSLVKIQDETGDFVQMIQPYGWMNTIGDMSNEEGYYFYVNQNTNFDVTGELVTLPYNVDLYEGWNILGYPVNTNQNALLLLQGLINDSTLIKVIDEQGGFIQHIPPYGWLNTIGVFKPDEGYLIKLTENDSITYTEVTKSESIPVPPKKLTECFDNFDDNPYMPMNIIIKKIIPRWFKIETGDELAVYDEETLVGSVVIYDTNDFHMIIARSDDPTTPEKDGFTPGNEIIFKYCDKSENEIYENVIPKYKWGDETYTNLGTYLGRLRVFGNKTKNLMTEIPEGITYLSQNYPNPFSNNTIIEYGINMTGRVRLTITDLSGHNLQVLVDEEKTEGDYSYYFVNNLKPGIYLYNLEIKNKRHIFVKTKKMITY